MIMTRHIKQNKNKNDVKIDVNKDHRIGNVYELNAVHQMMMPMLGISIKQNLHALQL
jgi:hypothetical protein